MNEDLLKPLKGFSSLEADEQRNMINSWVSRGLIDKDYWTFEDADRLYRNRQYANAFGVEAFMSNTDPLSRDKEFEAYILNNAIQSKYSEDSNFDRISNLTNEGKKEFLESVYNSPEEYAKKYAKHEEDYNKLDDIELRSQFSSPEEFGAYMTKKNTETLDAIYTKDLQRKALDTFKESSIAKENLYRGLESGEMTWDKIDEIFDSMTQGTEYTLRKDSKEFEDFTSTDKLDYISKMLGLTSKYSEDDAYNLIRADIQNYAKEHMSGGQKTANLWREFYTSVTSEAMNEIIGLRNIYLTFADPEELKANLEYGTTKDGEQLSNAINPLYWQGVKQYNTHSADEINKIRESGGLTPYKNLTRAGEEYDIFNITNIGNSLAEGIGQAAWMSMQSAILGGTVGKLGKVGKIASAVLEVGLPAVGGAHAESYEAFQNTLQEATESINKYIDEEVDKKLDEHLNSENFKTDFSNYIENRKKIEKEQGKVYFDEKALLEDYYKDYINGLANTYSSELKDSEQNTRLQEEAKEAALTAYGTAFAISTIKNSGATAMLRRAFLSKGTRQLLADNADDALSRTTINVDGSLQAGKLNWYTRNIKPVTKNFFGEGADEWLDVVINNGGQNFGIEGFNDFLTKEVDPDNYNEVLDNGLYHLIRGLNALPEDVLTKEALFEAGMGAFSGALRLTPRFGWAFDKNIRGQSFRTDAKGNRLSLAESLSKYISNQALEDAAEARRSQRQYEAEIQAANEVLEKHKDDLALIGKTISTLSDQDSPNDGTLQVADTKHNNIIKAAFLLKDLVEGKYTGMSTSVTESIDKIERMANGNLSETETEELITEFLGNPANKSIAQMSNAREIALEKLQDNAKQFQSIRSTIDTEYEKLSRNRRTKNLSDYAKRQIIFTQLQADNWEHRLNSIGQELGIQNSWSTSMNASAEFGSKEAFWRERKELFKAEEEVSKHIEALNQTLENTKKKLRTASSKEEIAALELVIKATEGALEQANTTLQKIQVDKSSYKELESFFESNEKLPVLSESEILALSPQQMARMLDKRFYGDYSIEQRIIIDRVRNSLINKNPNALEMINDRAVLADRIDANREAQSRMLDNPELLSSYIAAAQKYRQHKIESSAYERAKNKLLERLEPLNDEQLVEATKNLSPDAIGLFTEAHPEKKELLSPILEFSKFRRDVSNTIFGMYNNKSDRGALSTIVNYWTKEAQSSEEYMSSLEDALDSKFVDPLKKEEIKKLLTSLEQIGYQRDATKVQSREERQEAKKKAEEQETLRLEGERIRKEEELKKAEKEAPIPTVEQYDEVPKTDIILEGEEASLVEEAETAISEESKEDEKSVEETPIITTPTIEPETFEDDNPTSLQGSRFWRYDLTPIKYEGKQVLMQGSEEGDSMNTLFKWLESLGGNYQDIIDHELSRIMRLNPDVHMMMSNDREVWEHMFEVIEYTDKVKRIHPENKGNIISSNGKQWLVIGVIGFGNKEQQRAYYGIKDALKVERGSRPDDRFVVSEKYKTKIEHLHNGYITRALEGEEVAFRTLTELTSDPKRNPRNLGIEDLKWGIITPEGMLQINTSERLDIASPKDISGNVGNVFLLVESASGKYIPIYMKPVRYEELRDGELKSEIDTYINELSSPVYKERKEAKDKLSQRLVYNADNDIIIGGENNNIVTIKKDGVVIKTFDLNNPEFNRLEFIETVKSIDARINVNKSILSDPYLVQKYDAAGVFLTDIAKLATSNSGFSVYSMDKDTGEPNIPNEPNPSLIRPASEYTRKQEHSVLYLGKVYREFNGEFRDALDKVVTDPIVIEQLRLLQRIKQMAPVISKNNYDYYILNSDVNNPSACKVHSSGKIKMATKEQALKLIEQSKEKAIRESQQEALDNIIVPTEEVPLNAYEEAVKPKESKPKPESKKEVKPDINTITNDSVMQEEKTSYDVKDILKDVDYGETLDEIINEKLEKGEWEDSEGKLNTVQGTVEYLKNKGIQIFGITDVNSWLEMVRECK